MSLLDGDDAFAAMPEPLIHTIDTIDNQCAEEDLSEPISLQPEQPALSASIVPLPKPHTPSNETKLLYVCVDIEHTNPTPCLSEIFEIAVAAFATEVVGHDTSVEYIECEPVVERIKPSLEFGNNEFYWKTIELTGYRLKNVEECRTFPYVMERIEKYVEESRRQYKCKEVVLCGWNLYSVDHRILVHDYNRRNRDRPDSWRWGWDGYRSVFAKQDHRFKIKSRTKKKTDGLQRKQAVHPCPLLVSTMPLLGDR